MCEIFINQWLALESLYWQVTHLSLSPSPWLPISCQASVQSWGWGGYKKHLCLLPTPDFGRKIDPVDYYTIPVKASVCIQSCGTSEETDRCCVESWGRCYHRGSNWIGLGGMRRSFIGGQGEERCFRPEEQRSSGWESGVYIQAV